MNKVYRKDCAVNAQSCRVIWAWRSQEFDEHREGMLLLYGLTPENDVHPEILGIGMTHEFTAYEVDPTTRIDFEKSLFNQKNVSPLVPAAVGFQFRAETDDLAVARMQSLVDEVMEGRLALSQPEKWAAFFPDGVHCVVTSPSEFADFV